MALFLVFLYLILFSESWLSNDVFIVTRMKEGDQLRTVLNHPIFHSDPLAAIHQHLLSTQPPDEKQEKRSSKKGKKAKKQKSKASLGPQSMEMWFNIGASFLVVFMTYVCSCQVWHFPLLKFWMWCPCYVHVMSLGLYFLIHLITGHCKWVFFSQFLGLSWSPLCHFVPKILSQATIAALLITFSFTYILCMSVLEMKALFAICAFQNKFWYF